MRLKRGKEDPSRIGERRGRPGLARPRGRLVWLHGASVGEAVSLLPFVERIARSGASALVTTGTVTSAALLEQRLPPGALHQYAPARQSLFSAPLSRPLAARRGALRRIRAVAQYDRRDQAHAGLPLAMINGRMSERSFNRWRKAPRFIGALLGRFDLCLARSEGDGERLLALGAPNVLIAGDIKFDAPALPADRRELAELSGLTSGRQIWIAASTHEGEELIAAEAHKRLTQVFPDALTLIAPRHPERGEAILRQLEAQGLVCALRSRGDRPGPGTAVYICDTIGELGLFYRLAGVVFVGKSFSGGGGQNPIEPARLASAILHGPMVDNFSEAYAALDLAGGALEIADPADLGDALISLFANAAQLRAMARAAADAVERRGRRRRTVDEGARPLAAGRRG